MKINIQLNYRDPVQFTEEWAPLPALYCPACGQKSVWHETGPGDYYVEELHLCIACGSQFYLPGGICPQSTDPHDANNQRIRQFRQHEKTHKT